jgi:hypothetical protein
VAIGLYERAAMAACYMMFFLRFLVLSGPLLWAFFSPLAEYSPFFATSSAVYTDQLFIKFKQTTEKNLDSSYGLAGDTYFFATKW